ncbi:hypothetical protein IFM53868_05955 [Aspergillus udagawae]|uniref:CCHC-type domain-containing protein n=1 Tax=Aspergillus udagawae TaxID=91492 RepID=A0ABQ1AXW3_9EURO|nr:hypothetical protein IFM53868_05955 [Aspergillus udagawae]
MDPSDLLRPDPTDLQEQQSPTTPTRSHFSRPPAIVPGSRLRGLLRQGNEALRHVPASLGYATVYPDVIPGHRATEPNSGSDEPTPFASPTHQSTDDRSSPQTTQHLNELKPASPTSSTSQDTVVLILGLPTTPPDTTESNRRYYPIGISQTPDMAKSNIKPFYGRRDNAEDPYEYIQDIEYEIKLEKRHFTDPSYNWDEDRCILFRQNLRDKAELWYSQLNRTTKDGWELLKNEFLRRYQIDEVDAATRRFQVSQRVATLAQGQNEHILEYLNRCEDLESQAGTLESFGLNVVQGISDRTQKQNILFNLNMKKDYSFRAAKEVINAAYLSFDPDSIQHRMNSWLDRQQGQLIPQYTTEEVFRQTMPVLVQGIRTLLTTQQNAHPNLQPQMASNPNRVVDLNPTQPLSDRAEAGSSGYNRRFPNPNLTCFNCGEKGHYATGCKKPPTGNAYRPRIAANAALDPGEYEDEGRSSVPAACVMPTATTSEVAFTYAHAAARPNPVFSTRISKPIY